MALPPTIPTSFVPRQQVNTPSPRQLETGVNMFLVVSFVVAGIVILMAVGVFSYGRFLRSEADQKAAELKTAEASVSQDTVEGFLRLKNRLNSSETILTQHVVLSQFLTIFEGLTLTSVRFSSLNITVAPDHGAELKMTGTARDFNALAAQSAAFASEKRIKQAIFSGITSDKTGVTFNVTAKLDPRTVDIADVSASSDSSMTPEIPATPAAPENPAAPAQDATTTTP